MSNIFGKVQKVGKAFMLPIAVLPIAALFLRLGADDILGIPFIFSMGQAIFDNLAILFAIGIAVGLAKDNHGAAGLAGAVSYYTLTLGTKAINDTINMGVLAGIIAGLVAGGCYNKFHRTKLPDWLGFFGGKRLVPIMSSLFTMILALGFGYVWPPIQGGIDSVGNWMIGAGAPGVFAFGTLNRLLIPTGLHHILNNIVWFVFGEYNGATGDLGRFFAGDPAAGSFMTGFFPIMMFALPAAALAMYTTAKKEYRNTVAGALFSVAFTAFLTGITEPIEFMFMFLAPVLYFAHAIFTGLSMAICYVFEIRSGFGFSGGFLDYVLSFGLATKPLLILVLGAGFGAIYYVLFTVIIKKMDLPTPGRVDESGTGEGEKIISERGLEGLAAEYIMALGGSANIEEIDACITRLRLTLKDATVVEDRALKMLGASGVIRPTKKNVQVVVGTKAELIVDEMKRIV